MESQDFLEKGYFYHIYNKGNNHEDLFLEADNYSYFLNLVEKYWHPIFEIYAYCLLKNHFHFLLKIKDDCELSEDKLHLPFSNLFNAYAKAINKKYSREGSLFKKRYKRQRITDEKYLINTILYIHLNPVKQEFTDNFEDYEFSSYRSILSNKPTKLKRLEVLEMFDDKENFKASHKLRVIDKFDLEL